MPELPPGPGILGSLRFVRRPFELLDDCTRRWGDWFTLRFPGVPPFVFTSDPEAAREIFAGDADALRAGEANRPLGAFMGARSLLLLDGAEHLRERRRLQPPFNASRMQAYADVIADVTDRAIDGWPVGRPFSFHASMQAVTFEVILRAVFGLDREADLVRLREPLRRLFALFASPLGGLLAFPVLRADLGRWTPGGRAARLRREVDAVLLAEIARRRADGATGRADVLSLLVTARDEDGQPMADVELRDEMLTLLLAGHETTAASLAWVLHRVLGRSDVRERLRTDPGGVYLDAVIKEASRLDPVIPNVGRALPAPLTIAGRTLPAGVVVAPCIYLVHRRPDLWPDPDRFAPERFLDGAAPPSAFFPFGGGVRRCLGAAFATHEMKVVLGRVLARADVEAAPGYRARLVRRSIAFAPSEGLPVVVTAVRPQ